MKIKLHEIPVREVVESYKDSAEGGTRGYGGRLNIRPAFQREYIYNEKQRNEVIRTVRKGFPLNVMYWVLSDDGNFEMLDGQQRTISICQYVAKEYTIDHDGFDNLTKEEQEQIRAYTLMVYICEGTDREKLDWFEIVNTVGEQLSSQERRNAIYTGEWLTESKKYFSKNGCAAYAIASQYMKGSAIRQDYLETAIRWLAAKGDKEIEDYMAAHQHDTDCNELWLYFQTVINWVVATFPNYRKEMKGLEWGLLYNKYGAEKHDPKKLEARIIDLMQDEDITKFSGIYEYLLSGEAKKAENFLSIRNFNQKMARTAFERQKGMCPKCNKTLAIDEMEADHITPWSKGGKTIAENCQMLCKDCNRRKSDV
jgi:hypothetical protein